MSQRPLVPRWFAVMIAASLAIVVLGIFRPEANPGTEPQPTAAPAADAPLVECLWLDRLPEDPYEPFQMYFFTEEGGRVGLNAKAESAFKILLEVFEFIDLSDRATVQFYFPHDRRKPASAYKVEKMKKPTAYFDTMLTLENDPQNGGKKTVYYTGPEFRPEGTGKSLPAHLQRLVTQVQAAREASVEQENAAGCSAGATCPASVSCGQASGSCAASEGCEQGETCPDREGCPKR